MQRHEDLRVHRVPQDLFGPILLEGHREQLAAVAPVDRQAALRGLQQVAVHLHAAVQRAGQALRLEARHLQGRTSRAHTVEVIQADRTNDHILHPVYYMLIYHDLDGNSVVIRYFTDASLSFTSTCLEGLAAPPG